VVEPYDSIPGLARVTLFDRKGIFVGEGDYLNGQPHGVWMEFEPNTNVIRVMDSYRYGTLHGPSIRIDRNGNLTSKSDFYLGQPHGKQFFYKNGKLVEEKTYKMGQLEGKSIKYYENGNKMEEANYTNGVMDGLARWFDMEGNLKFQYLYEKGKLVDQNPSE
jgi:antitoxin component YwqK of YwqJK toxin-antitoxin module